MDQVGDPTESTGWHGWGGDGWSLHVGPLPGRKSVCLYSHIGSIVEPLAYFRDDESAFRALAMFDRIVNLLHAQYDGDVSP